MKFKVTVYDGVRYQDEVKYVVVSNHDGETAILQKHVPIILTVDKGFVKLVSEDSVSYLVLENGVVTFKNNELNVLALEAQIGPTYEKAKSAFDKAKKANLEEEKKDNIDMSKLEMELRESIIKSGAGRL
ncbi:F-type H+-transporting ATPase epsilon chain [Alteracholeplasma palmae J233]|uniref:ATP synthase epsilon chain n=1 Tax=Alteracholeplasma palmae (strain ATCC 49389 / J233) TaxID=1318466 RepID=U4KLI3_ALTPJ|nr:F-type H+-transporting ATPase epsilon chain [Alteracholeplasma palmae]CCV64809.1 F-type H+-transporting ATPase epsilon chain [Alteracholeplasma palmae J233]